MAREVARAEHEAGDGEHQQERRQLAPPAHVEAVHAEEQRGDRRSSPPTSTSRTSDGEQNHTGAASAMMIAIERDDEQQPVDGRVEHLAELADLTEPPGEVAVDPVGGAEAAEQPRRGGRVVAAEAAGTGTAAGTAAGQREQVGDREQRRRPRRRPLTVAGHGVSQRPASARRRRVRPAAHGARPRSGDADDHASSPGSSTARSPARSCGATTAAWRSCRSTRWPPATRSSCPIAEVDHWLDADPSTDRPPVRGRPGHRVAQRERAFAASGSA